MRLTKLATRQLTAAAAALLLLAPLAAHAEGDAAAGEKAFGKCKACHAITAPDGTSIVKGGKTGPDLYGVVGRGAGVDFNYSPSMVSAHEKGLVWDETNLVAYLADPTAFLKDYLADPSAKSKMTFKLSKGAEDIAAYLTSVVKSE